MCPILRRYQEDTTPIFNINSSKIISIWIHCISLRGASSSTEDSPLWEFMASSGHDTLISQEEEEHDDTDAIAPINPQAYLSESTITPPVLMQVKEVQGDPCVFMDNYGPIRYLGLCCGGSLEVIEELASHGRSFDRIYLCDNDDVARTAAQYHLMSIAERHDERFSPMLKEDIYEGLAFDRIPQDVRLF